MQLDKRTSRYEFEALSTCSAIIDTMDTQLEKLTTQPENHQVDFKQMGVLSGSLKDVAKHLVAFANRRGGILLFGITDSGRIEGKSFGKEKASRELQMQLQIGVAHQLHSQLNTFHLSGMDLKLAMCSKWK